MFRWTVHLKRQPKRYEIAAVAAAHKVYFFGINGYSLSPLDRIDVLVFNTVSLRWLQLPPAEATSGMGERPLDEVPCMRCGHTAVLIEETIYVWGGMKCTDDLPYCNVLYGFRFDAHQWFVPSVSGTAPEARKCHSACVLGSFMYIYGGYLLTGVTNDIHKLDTATMAWASIDARGTPPPAVKYHSATIIGTHMFVFGGHQTHQDYYNNMRVFDTQANSWLGAPYPQLPERRWWHSAFAHGGELYMFGSEPSDLERTVNGLWRFSPGNFSWRRVEPKGSSPSQIYRRGCCMVGDRIIFFGRDSVAEDLDDLYVLDLSPSLKTLCKLAVIQCDLDRSELPHDIRWELAAMTTNGN